LPNDLLHVYFETANASRWLKMAANDVGKEGNTECGDSEQQVFSPRI
jgi:hypothetical protein